MDDATDELLRSAIDAAPDGILVVDATGQIVMVNPMAGEMFGYDPHELHGLNVDRLVPEPLRSTHPARRDAYMRHPKSRPMGSGLDLRGLRRSGDEFPVEISLSPVQFDGEPFVIAVVRDVTERRAASDELMQAHEQLALVDDRERIARDLHDTVIQRLFGVGLSLQGMLIGVRDEQTAARVETAIDEIDGTIRDLRTAIFSLHARRMPTAGLREDLLATAREAGRALGFEPQVTFEGPIDSATPDAIREQLVPTLREALSNVVKHAAASTVAITVSVDASAVTLEVVDDGLGIGEHTHGGRGLGNMRERATAVGGECEIRPRSPKGTLMTWRAPLR